MKRLMTTLFACAIASLSACKTTAESYVAEMPGYSVVTGRITRIENLHTEDVTPLSDGMVFVLSQPDCRVSITFEDDQRKVFNVGQGVIIVHGAKGDYILESEIGN